MVTTDLVGRLEELLEPIAIRHGLELVAIETAGGRHALIVRVLLDKEGGMDLDAICAANRWISDTLDEVDPIPGTYTLEVSSPGVDRPLRKREDFVRFAGETVVLKTRPGRGARTAWTGVLVGLEGEDIIVDVDGEIVHVRFEDIVKARIKGVVDFGGTDSERGTR